MVFSVDSLEAKLHTQHRIRSDALNYIDASVQFVVEQVCIEMVEKKLNIRQRTLFLANSDIFPNFRRGCLQILHIGYTNCIFANITYHKCTKCTNELLIITIILLKSCNSYIKRISAAPAESNVKNQYRWWRLCIWIEQATRRRQCYNGNTIVYTDSSHLTANRKQASQTTNTNIRQKCWCSHSFHWNGQYSDRFWPGFRRQNKGKHPPHFHPMDFPLKSVP